MQGLQATAPGSYGGGAADPHVAQLVADYIQQNHLQANQSDPASLNRIAQYLQSQGINAQTAYTDQNGHTGGLVVNGQEMQLIDGSNRWTALQPWQESGGNGGGSSGGGSPADFMAQDPGFQFRMDEGRKALERSAAARGTLLTGGTAKALARYGQDYAAGEFGSIFNRNLQLAQLGERAAAGQADTDTGVGNAQGASSIQSGNAWGGAVNSLGGLGAFYATQGRGGAPPLGSPSVTNNPYQLPPVMY
jgi:hypothetical protein